MELQQKLAPHMIQSMEILQLPIIALQERIEQEMLENPVIELRDSSEEGSEGVEAEKPAEDDVDPGNKELVIDDSSSNAEDFERLEQMSRDYWEDQFNEEHRPSRGTLDEESDKKHDAMQNMASRPQSLQDYLNDQVAFLDATTEQSRLLRHLITFIDDRGFLNASLDEICHGYDRPVTPAEVEDVLHMLQKLDPPGVGARDLKECLLLQLTPEVPHRDVLRELIRHHLEDVAHNRLPAIQKATGFPLPVIKEAIEILGRLRPRPGEAFSSDSIPYVVPEIVVERRENGEYDVRLLDDWLPNVYISRHYFDLYKAKGSDPEMREYLKKKIQAAQWLQDSIAQRRSTLEKVTRAIIQHQRAFLDSGPEHIIPLKMQQIADQVGVHVTTISRAVDDKWVQTPRGIFPLKRFFGGGREVASGEEVAWEVIKQKLLEIIDKEDKSNPYSDEDLVSKLQEVGYPLARRTVTKYRKMANIPSSRQRKDWTAVTSTPPPVPAPPASNGSEPLTPVPAPPVS
jgi:RNA polymerase sigma-54 factor